MTQITEGPFYGSFSCRQRSKGRRWGYDGYGTTLMWRLSTAGFLVGVGSSYLYVLATLSLP